MPRRIMVTKNLPAGEISVPRVVRRKTTHPIAYAGIVTHMYIKAKSYIFSLALKWPRKMNILTKRPNFPVGQVFKYLPRGQGVRNRVATVIFNTFQDKRGFLLVEESILIRKVWYIEPS